MNADADFMIGVVASHGDEAGPLPAFEEVLSAQDWIAANAEWMSPSELWDIVARLAEGKAVRIGGGAMQEFTLVPVRRAGEGQTLEAGQ